MGEYMGTLWYYEFLFVAFLIFVYLNNGSVVCGEHSAQHKQSMHCAQILYLIGCLLLLCMLPIVANKFINKRMNLLQIKKYLQANWVLIVLLFCVFSYFRMRCTIAHEFLLSDNRHFSFYAWRYFLSKAWFSCLIIPVCVFGFLFIADELMQTAAISTFWCLSFGICCCCVLCPSPLLEFRYFIVPILIFKLNYLTSNELMDRVIGDCVDDKLESVARRKYKMMTLPIIDFAFNRLPNANVYKWMNICLYLAINIVTLRVYITKPFEWNDGSTARFMW